MLVVVADSKPFEYRLSTERKELGPSGAAMNVKWNRNLVARRETYTLLEPTESPSRLLLNREERLVGVLCIPRGHAGTFR